MNTQRTTLRLDPFLKKAAQTRAIEEGISMQELFSRALKAFINTKPKKKTGIKFYSHDLGEPLDNLTREDFYADWLQRLGLRI